MRIVCLESLGTLAYAFGPPHMHLHTNIMEAKREEIVLFSAPSFVTMFLCSKRSLFCASLPSPWPIESIRLMWNYLELSVNACSIHNNRRLLINDFYYASTKINAGECELNVSQLPQSNRFSSVAKWNKKQQAKSTNFHTIYSHHSIAAIFCIIFPHILRFQMVHFLIFMYIRFSIFQYTVYGSILFMFLKFPALICVSTFYSTFIHNSMWWLFMLCLSVFSFYNTLFIFLLFLSSSFP